MMNEKLFARQLALLRRESGMTQEEVAEKLHVTPQAVSKWENGRSLPETALLPAVARLLDVGIDTLFQDGNLMVLEAFYGDGLDCVSVTKRLNRLIEKESLCLQVSPSLLGSCPAEERVPYLTVKYRTKKGVCFAAVPNGEALELSAEDKPVKLPQDGLSIIAGHYGTKRYHVDVMHKIRHYGPFRWNAYRADHKTFPSNPASNETEYLTLIYRNGDGIHMATCAEGESLVYSDQGTRLVRRAAGDAYLIPHVDALPSFGEGMECSWAAALTAALKTMGHKTDYDQVMGVSGACYRVAFCSPKWDYSSADGLVAYDYAAPGYAAFGYTPEMHGHIEKSGRSLHRQKIMKELQSGRPVLGINLRVAPEWGVICGYGLEGDELYCRTKYDKKTIENDPEFMKGFTAFDPESIQNPYGYLHVDNWPFLLCYFTGKRQAPSEKENLIRSLTVLTDCMCKEQDAGYDTGMKAYAVWARDLRDDHFYETAGDEDFIRRFSVNQFCALALMDARRSARVYLKNTAERFPNTNLTAIAAQFDTSAGIAAEILKMTDSERKLAESEIRIFWTRDKRRKQAELLEHMADTEQKACDCAADWLAQVTGN